MAGEADQAKADLISALLALDSYNRGYGAGINGFTDDISEKIGNFTVYDHTNNAVGSADFMAGFYGIAYQVSLRSFSAQISED